MVPLRFPCPSVLSELQQCVQSGLSCVGRATGETCVCPAYQQVLAFVVLTCTFIVTVLSIKHKKEEAEGREQST